MQTRVKIPEKLLRKVANMPPMIGRKLAFWTEDVAHRGLQEVRKIPCYHDEPLKGKRFGQDQLG